MVNRSECDCECHSRHSIKHVVACCYYTSEQFFEHLEGIPYMENIHYIECDCNSPGDLTPLKSDIAHLLEVYIDNGMVESEDEEIINRLWIAIHGETKRG